MAGQLFLVLTGACQFGHGAGGFATNLIHSFDGTIYHTTRVHAPRSHARTPPLLCTKRLVEQEQMEAVHADELASPAAGRDVAYEVAEEDARSHGRAHLARRVRRVAPLGRHEKGVAAHEC